MTSAAGSIRILVADDERLFRAGLRLLLERAPAIRVVAEAATGAEAVAQYALHRPEVVLLDLRFPDRCGVEGMSGICEQFLIARILVLVACARGEVGNFALRSRVV